MLVPHQFKIRIPINAPKPKTESKALSTLSPKTATVAGKCDCCRKRLLSHFCAKHDKHVFGDKLSPKSATIIASVNRLLGGD